MLYTCFIVYAHLGVRHMLMYAFLILSGTSIRYYHTRQTQTE